MTATAAVASRVPNVARFLDAAVLKPELTSAEAVAIMREAIAAGVRTVCVRPCDTEIAAELCQGTSTGVCVVVGFPHGDTFPQIKAAEAAACLAKGASEIDMVANFGRIRSGDWAGLEAEVAAVVAVTKPAGALLKVIFESVHLSLDEITRATACCIAAQADFVKTSTGFNGAGASDEAVRAMLAAAGNNISVKPSGGIRDRARAEFLIGLGCQRLGVNAAALDAILAETAPVATASAAVSASSY